MSEKIEENFKRMRKTEEGGEVKKWV